MRPLCRLNGRVWFTRVLLCLFAFMPLTAFAHSMNQSAVLLDFHGDTVEAELQVPLTRLGLVWGSPLTAQSISQQKAQLGTFILDRVHAKLPNGRPFHVHLVSAMSLVVVDSAPYLSAHLELDPPSGSHSTVFEFTDDVLLDYPPSSVTLVSIRSDWNSTTFADDPQFVGILRTGASSVTIDRTGGSWFRGFRCTYLLGMRHIAEGTDHLLFLLALLLPAPLLALHHRWAGPVTVRSGLLRILRIVTAFTMGHSLTLAAAASGLVHVPGSPIEILIALSILVSAIHALRPIFPGREAFVAVFFGLIHGLAFATTLAGLGLGRWERVAGIFAFNLGIESMQLIVVVAAMPSLMLLSRTRLYASVRICGGLFASGAATGWMSQRLFGTRNPINGVVETLARHAISVAITAFAFALAAWALHQRSSRLPGGSLGD